MRERARARDAKGREMNPIQGGEVTPELSFEGPVEFHQAGRGGQCLRKWKQFGKKKKKRKWMLRAWPSEKLRMGGDFESQNKEFGLGSVQQGANCQMTNTASRHLCTSGFPPWR